MLMQPPGLRPCAGLFTRCLKLTSCTDREVDTGPGPPFASLAMRPKLARECEQDEQRADDRLLMMDSHIVVFEGTVLLAGPGSRGARPVKTGPGPAAASTEH
jgi:hypothetical protein